MSTKVDSGHDNVKKIVDMHKTNEDLLKQLSDKDEGTKDLEKKVKDSQAKIDEYVKKRDELETDFANQKQAYEVLLDSMAGFEDTENK
jgi:predicted  nucleic acid-binding Zn-ribbon protein